MSASEQTSSTIGKYRKKWKERRVVLNTETILLGTSIGVIAMAFTVVVYAGWGFYQLPEIDRVYSDERALYGTNGTIGLVCGMIAFALLSSNFGYFIRRHAKTMSRVGTLRRWLDWHVVSAIFAAGFVALHANFAMRNWLVRTCVYSLSVAIATGLIGRYLLRFVPRSASGARMSGDEFSNSLYDLIDEVRGDIVHDPAAVSAIEGLVAELDNDREISTLHHVREHLDQCRGYISIIEESMRRSGAAGAQRAGEMHRKMSSMARQAAVIHRAGRMMDSWRALHRTFALLLLCGMVTHVAVAIYYGYGALWQ